MTQNDLVFVWLEANIMYPLLHCPLWYLSQGSIVAKDKSPPLLHGDLAEIEKNRKKKTPKSQGRNNERRSLLRAHSSGLCRC